MAELYFATSRTCGCERGCSKLTRTIFNGIIDGAIAYTLQINQKTGGLYALELRKRNRRSCTGFNASRLVEGSQLFYRSDNPYRVRRANTRWTGETRSRSLRR